jgi:hypothetical protein
VEKPAQIPRKNLFKNIAESKNLKAFCCPGKTGLCLRLFELKLKNQQSLS